MSEPTLPTTPVTIDTLIAEFNDLAAKRDAKTGAHATTLGASQNVTDVTVTEQSLIDQATAHFDQATTEAKQSQQEAVADETAAADAEETVFAQLKADLDAFKAATP